MSLSRNSGARKPSSGLEGLLKLAIESDARCPADDEIEKYLYERYLGAPGNWKRSAYYFIKPVIPRPLQLRLRREYTRIQSRLQFPSWPIETALVDTVARRVQSVLQACNTDTVCRIAPWPGGSSFCFSITHDVEGEEGLRNALTLAGLERDLGFISSWNIVPERYPIDWKIVEDLRSRGCEIGVHGLRHDGRDFHSRRMFSRRAERINAYASSWGASGFRAPSTMRNVEWMPLLNFEYDSSFPDTDPYEPQPGGCCNIWPYFIGDLVELPITMPQDHTLFEILGRKDIGIWKEKADWIQKNSGLILIDVHPDYMLTGERLRLYEELLRFMKTKDGMWHALPKDVARWWRERDATVLDEKDGAPFVTGPAFARASVLRTSLANGSLVDETLGTVSGSAEAIGRGR